MRKLFLSTALCILSWAASAAHAAWTPPIGIPTPAFGIENQAPAVPNPWTTSTPGFYYICQSCANATNVNNPYGTPAKPRMTIPSQVDGGSLLAGSVVEMHGTYSQGHTKPYHLLPQGTAAKPVFIRGVPGSEPTLLASWEIDGSYTIIENLHWTLMSSPDKGAVLMIGDHLAFRKNDVKGNHDSGQVVPIGAYNVVYNNVIHDGGNYATTTDQDIQCIQVSGPTSYLWVVDNEMARCTGDGMQINGGTDLNSIHHVFVGRNLSHHNRQMGLWTKSARDIVFSQNTVYGHRVAQWGGGGGGLGWQYEPTNVWFLFNHVYDNEQGIGGGGSDDPYPQQIFIIGNVIHNNHSKKVPYCDNLMSAWCAAGINALGGSERFIIGNTVFDNDMGITGGYPNNTTHIANNIVANLTQSVGYGILMEGPWDLHNNLFFGSVAGRMNVPDGTYTVATLESTHSNLASNNLTSDPRFVNAPAGDFHLQSNSPAIDAGVDISAITNIYQQAFGVDISIDVECIPRPQGSGWDLGAYEYNTLTSKPECPSAPIGGGGGGPLPAPTLHLPAYMPVNGRINVEYPPGYNLAGFIWGIFPSSANPASVQSSLRSSALAMPRSVSGQLAPGRASSAIFATTSRYADLASYQLSTGTYLVAVAAVDMNSSVSAPAMGTVTMVMSGLDNVRVFPNPWRADRHDGYPITFDGLTVNTHIKIFTVSGHWVKDLPTSSSVTTWDLSTNSGDKAASGIYMYLIKTDDGQKRTGQITVIK